MQVSNWNLCSIKNSNFYILGFHYYGAFPHSNDVNWRCEILHEVWLAVEISQANQISYDINYSAFARRHYYEKSCNAMPQLDWCLCCTWVSKYDRKLRIFATKHKVNTYCTVNIWLTPMTVSLWSWPSLKSMTSNEELQTIASVGRRSTAVNVSKDQLTT